MINKITSKDLMQVLTDSQQSIKDIESDIAYTKSELSKRLAVIENMQGFIEQQESIVLGNMEEGYSKKKLDKIVFPRADIVAGTYDLYGATICPKAVRVPADIFNLNSMTGPIFKNNMTVYVNGAADEGFKSMLMDDTIVGKSIAFGTYDSPDITLEIAVNPNDMLGSTDFNTIEFLPYIPGSFTINSIEVYSLQGYYLGSALPDLTIQRDIPAVGASRLLIDQIRTLYRLVLTIHVDYKNAAGKYPFGLKHLYLTKANYSTSSNVIVKVTHDDYIASIGEDIVVSDQNGIYNSTLTEEGIKLYMSYQGGTLSYEIQTSHGYAENQLARNITEFYAQVPVDRCISSIRFLDITNK